MRKVQYQESRKAAGIVSVAEPLPEASHEPRPNRQDHAATVQDIESLLGPERGLLGSCQRPVSK